MASKKDSFKKQGIALPGVADIKGKTTSALQSILETAKPEHRSIPNKIIAFNPANDYGITDAPADIEVLADDLKRNGLIHNLVVSYHQKEDRYVLLSGERRLRAIRLNQERDPAGGWDEVFVQIRVGLTERQEMIVLDAANIMARGSGMRNETKTRKAIKRFIKNIQEEFDLTEDAAKELTAQVTGTSLKTIDRNLDIESNLIPELLALVDSNMIPKASALAYTGLGEEDQQVVADNYKTLLETAGEQAVAKYSKETTDAIKNNKKVASVKPRTDDKNRSMVERQKEKAQKNIDSGRRSLTALKKQYDYLRDFSTDDAATLKQQIGELYEEAKALWDKVNDG